MPVGTSGQSAASKWDGFKKMPEYRAYRKVQRLTERFNALLRRRVILWLTANAAKENDSVVSSR